MFMLCSVTQPSPTLCNPMDCSLPGSSVHGMLQARILEWVAMLSSRGSSQPRDWTQVSCTAGRFFTVWATREAHHQCLWPLNWRRQEGRCMCMWMELNQQIFFGGTFLIKNTSKRLCGSLSVLCLLSGPKPYPCSKNSFKKLEMVSFLITWILRILS